MATQEKMTPEKNSKFPIWHVYPRLKTFIKEKRKTGKWLAEEAGIHPNYVSNIFSGQPVQDEKIEACQVAINKHFPGEFDFSAEAMPAQINYKSEDIKRFIDNNPISDVAEAIGIDKYLLEWIVSEKYVSEATHEVIVRNINENAR